MPGKTYLERLDQEAGGVQTAILTLDQRISVRFASGGQARTKLECAWESMAKALRVLSQDPFGDIGSPGWARAEASQAIVGIPMVKGRQRLRSYLSGYLLSQCVLDNSKPRRYSNFLRDLVVTIVRSRLIVCRLLEGVEAHAERLVSRSHNLKNLTE